MSEVIRAGLSEFKRNLRRGFEMLVKQKQPSDEEIVMQASFEAQIIIKRLTGHEPELSEVVQSADDVLPAEIISSGVGASRAAIKDLMTPGGLIGTGIIAALLGKAGVNRKVQALNQAYQAIKRAQSEQAVSLDELVEYVASVGLALAREIREARFYREIDKAMDERGLTPYVDKVLSRAYVPFGKLLGGGKITGKFLAGEILAMGGAITLSEAMEALGESASGETITSILKALEVTTPAALYVIGEIQESGDRTALSVPMAAAHLAKRAKAQES